MSGLSLMLNQPVSPVCLPSSSPARREKKMEVSWEAVRAGKTSGKKQDGGRGGAGGGFCLGWLSLPGTSPPVRAPHSGTFQHSSRQSTVRGPGTDPRSACQQLISLIELARDPKSHVHHTRRHRRNTCATRCVHCSTQRHLAEGY